MVKKGYIYLCKRFFQKLKMFKNCEKKNWKYGEIKFEKLWKKIFKNVEKKKIEKYF